MVCTVVRPRAQPEAKLLYESIIRDCGSNLYVGMRVVDSRVGKGERTS